VEKIIATDITPEMLTTATELAKQKGINNLTTQIADAESLPFDDESFDLLTCRLAFHHFTRQAQSLSEFARVLKPGGIVGFTDNYTADDQVAAVFYNLLETIRDPSHFWVTSINQLSEMFYDAGFEILHTQLLSKELEFHGWADRQRVSDADKTRLLAMLDEVPELLLPLLQPRKTDQTTYFSLAEAVIIARKSEDLSMLEFL
jgi:ubiquinone/menaquinone biosynthesis C-methylase UbiE